MNTKNLRTEHRNGQMIPTVYELGWREKTWQSFKQLDCWFSTRYGFRKASNEGYCTKPKLRKSNIAVENLKDHCPPEISHSRRKIHGLVQFIYIYTYMFIYLFFAIRKKGSLDFQSICDFRRNGASQPSPVIFHNDFKFLLDVVTSRPFWCF